MSDNTRRRWFAIIYKREGIGYALDYYPNEKDSCVRLERDAIIGDFATRDEAMAVVRQYFEEMQ
jgi:hypothetical protein